MSNLMKNEIEIASKWWADQLRNKTKKDNGDEEKQEIGFVMKDTELKRTYVSSFPTRKNKAYKETQYSKVRTRTGIESVPLLGLEPGIHKVIFIKSFTNDEKIYTVKVWRSMYGWAWMLIDSENKDSL